MLGVTEGLVIHAQLASTNQVLDLALVSLGKRDCECESITSSSISNIVARSRSNVTKIRSDGVHQLLINIRRIYNLLFPYPIVNTYPLRVLIIYM